ncbi:hypothetical protein [Desulfosediminicola sp.]|uniref:hypothetical protein n=1 Tax=Desulfosediminicola sp. TaxID=2886825 RepID=UPI003AF29507
MAQIVGYQQGKEQKVPLTQVALIVIVGFSLIGFMLVSDQKWQEHMVSLVCAVLVILVLVYFAFNRKNPNWWKRYFKKADHARHLQGEKKIVEALSKLGDDYTILCGFTLELIHVSFLVLSPKGIFVIGKATLPGAIRVEQETLMAGDESLAKCTGNLWRVSHLVNLLIKKGYSTEIMPKPILVPTHSDSLQEALFDGISIVKPEGLALLVETLATEEIRPDLIHGFTAYLYQRYFK